MSKKKDIQEEAGEEDIAAEQQSTKPVDRVPVMIHAQYIKDLSFENPNAPQSLWPGKKKPVMDVNFNMDAKKIEDFQGHKNSYEVTLGVQATAKREEGIAFIVEIEFGMTVSLDDVPPEQVRPMLLIEMPRYAFPFVRQIVSNVTQQAGFMPLLLTPVDFKAFYVQRYGAIQKKIQDAGEQGKKSA